MKNTDWTNEDIEYLKQNYNSYPRNYFVNYFNKTTSQVQIMINKLGIKKNEKQKIWTDSEISFLRENYPIFGSEKCATIMGVSRVQIRQKAADLKIKGNLRKELAVKNPENKICRVCLLEKPLGLFGKRGDSACGIKSSCIECCRGLHKTPEYKARRLERSRKERRENPEKINKRHREYLRKRRKNDLSFRLRNNISRRITLAIKEGKGKKDHNTTSLLGCSIEDLKKHLESKFQIGMTWENRGFYGWHIDHIKPCSSFDLADPKQQKECFHYTNLQPLWWRDNLSKGSKILV